MYSFIVYMYINTINTPELEAEQSFRVSEKKCVKDFNLILSKSLINFTAMAAGPNHLIFFNDGNTRVEKKMNQNLFIHNFYLESF